MQIKRIFKGVGTFLGSMAATAIAVQGVSAFFGGVTISLFDAAPEDKSDNSFVPSSEESSFAEPVVAVPGSTTMTASPKIAKKLSTSVSKQTVSPTPKQAVVLTPKSTFAPILLPSDAAVATNAVSGGSGGSTGSWSGSGSTGSGGSNATSGGSGSGGSGSGSGGSGSGGGESREDNDDREDGDDD